MGRKKNAFTLIELISVLVILAIIALIVIPLVMNIVKKAKDSANKRSVDAYGKAVELAVATYLLDNGDYPTTLDDLTIEYTGNEVACNVKTLNEDGSIYLSECSVKGTEVKDSSTEDGYYHYGKSSSTVYKAYSIGDIVEYNGMNFYVIENSDESSDIVTMLKAEPLTVDEVNTYGVGFINKFTATSQNTTNNVNGYGGVVYYSSETCRYGSEDGCTTRYDDSDIKKIVDNWALDKFISSDLKVDLTGNSVRLISEDDLKNNFGYESVAMGTSDEINLKTPSNSYNWIYNEGYKYWTMSPYKDDLSRVWYVSSIGDIGSTTVYGYTGFDTSVVVRPVVTILKSAIN